MFCWTFKIIINIHLDERKSAKDKEREEKLITTIAKLVEARNRLTTDLEQMRLK